MNEESAKSKKIVPPIWLAISILVMAMLDRMIPVGQFGGPFIWGFASAFFVTGIGTILASLKLFSKLGTGVVPFSDTTAVASSGPYKFTRNPMYLGMVLILVGLAVALGSLVPFIVIPVFAWIIHTQFILPEEQFMEEAHGEAYLTYKNKVRRWV